MYNLHFGYFLFSNFLLGYNTNLKGIVSTYDNALFLWHDATSNLMSILAMSVDDFIFCGNNTFQGNMISELKRIFQVGT